MVNIGSYIDPRLVLFSEAQTREEAIGSLVDLLDQSGKLHDKEAFYQAVLQREKLVSTGIGMGVAFPHAKLPGYEEFFIAIGILSKPIDWQSIDRIPIRIIFLIGGPADKQTEYLQLLSQLTLLIKNEQIRKKMLTVNSAEGIIQLLK